MSTAAEPVVRVEHVSKRYARDLRTSLRYAMHDIGRELLRRPPPSAPRPGEFTALDDVSFELRPGEALGVMGPNGAGKSTLLKILHGLVKPDGGSARVRGRVGALIELGTGFDPVLTARENIEVNAAILGLTDRELAGASEQVLAFAELEDAADTPVRFYSSGMGARLGFAVAAHLRPDVLLVDEVLAVGDLAFQRKCYRHMREYLDRGGTLMIVSHNVFQLQTLCKRGMVLDRGRVAFSGTAVEAVSRYLAMLQPAVGEAARAPSGGHDPVTIERVTATTPGGGPPRTGEPLTVTVTYRCAEPVTVTWGFNIWTGDHWVCVAGDYDLRYRRIEGRDELRATIPRLPLLAGTYVLRGSIIDTQSSHPFAMFGHDEGAPVVLRVESDPALTTNALAAVQQLVTLDVDWD